jgi:perosamine synthetase
MVVTGDLELKERMDSERNQGRAPNMDWLDHDRLGFNYRLSDIASALGLAQLQRLDELLGGRERVAGLYRAALQEVPEVTLPCENMGQARRGWFVYVIQLPRGVDRDAVVTQLGARGVAAKPYFPAIHLMSYYRKTFGYRQGQFPICEDVASRSIAIPFFPRMSEGQVARVAEELGAVLQSIPRARGSLASRA